jgi:hypothetical protein
MDVEITQELFDAGKSYRGGWSAKQLKVIGIEWPPEKGWMQKAMGKRIPDSDAQLFIQLRKTKVPAGQAKLDFSGGNLDLF